LSDRARSRESGKDGGAGENPEQRRVAARKESQSGGSEGREGACTCRKRRRRSMVGAEAVEALELRDKRGSQKGRHAAACSEQEREGDRGGRRSVDRQQGKRERAQGKDDRR